MLRKCSAKECKGVSNIYVVSCTYGRASDVILQWRNKTKQKISRVRIIYLI